jgi:hypothetical protein
MFYNNGPRIQYNKTFLSSSLKKMPNKLECVLFHPLHPSVIFAEKKVFTTISPGTIVITLFLAVIYELLY